MKILHTIAFILVVVGALNWGLVGAGGWNVVEMLGEGIAKVVYILVGLSGLILVFTHKQDCKSCEPKASATPTM